MARALAAVEHGGTALVMLTRLQEGLTQGPRRPLPGRALSLEYHDVDRSLPQSRGINSNRSSIDVLAPAGRVVLLLVEADDGAGQLQAVGGREVRGDITPARTLGDPYVRRVL
jgi:hypothetical protein